MQFLSQSSATGMLQLSNTARVHHVCEVCNVISIYVGGEDDDSTIHSYSAAALSRFFFVLGRTSLQHLLNIEQTSKAIRAARLAADRAAAEAVERQMSAAAGSSSGGARRGKASASAASAVQPAPEDIGAQLGVGSVAADAELDALAETIEAQVCANGVHETDSTLYWHSKLSVHDTAALVMTPVEKGLEC